MTEHFHVVPAELGKSANRVHASSAKARDSVAELGTESGQAARANQGWASADALTACAHNWSARMHALAGELTDYAERLGKAGGAYEGADTRIAGDLRALAKDLGD